MKKAILAGCLAAVLLVGLSPLLLQSEAVKLAEPEPEAVPEDAVNATLSPDPDAAAVSSGWDAGETLTVLVDGTPVTMTMAAYLEGVVLGEMPASFPTAALEAQAVAARTFAMRREIVPKHENADICSESSCCQQYLTPDEARTRLGDAWSDSSETVRAAVAATDGLVLTYEGSLIDAVYFSCSGGRTEDAAAVWGGDVPYLQSVESPGEEISDRYQDTVTVSAETFRDTILSADPAADLSGTPVEWFGHTVYTEGGGVDTMTIGGVLFTGTELRSLFQLRSAWFSVAVDGSEIVFETRGFGHRVGMSQYGAKAMAEDGADFRDILTHYYTGVDVVPAASLTS